MLNRFYILFTIVCFITVTAFSQEAGTEDVNNKTISSEKPYWWNTHPRVMLTTSKFTRILEDSKRLPVLDSLLQFQIKAADRIVKMSDPVYRKTDDEEQLWQREVGNAIPVLAMAWLQTNEKKYLDAAVTWTRNAMEYPVWGTAGTDLGAGHLLFGIAVLYDWCYDKLDPVFRTQLENEMLKRGEIIYRSLLPGGSWIRDVYLQNHLWVTQAGLLASAVSMVDKYPQVQPWIDTVRAKTKRTFELLGDDGASHEGVGYWTYGVEYLLRYMDMVQQLYGENNYNSEWFRKTARYYLALALPKNAWSSKIEVVDIADSPRQSWYGPNHILRKLAAEYRDRYAQQRALELDKRGNPPNGSEWQGILWFDADLKGKAIDDYPTFTNFHDIGIVSTRSSWSGNESMLVFKCGPPLGHNLLKYHNSFGSAGHVHPDAGSFSLFGNGRFLIRNPGYSIKRTRYQNTLIVNNKGQKGESRWFRYQPTAASSELEEKISLKVIMQSNDIDYLLGTATNAYPDSVGLKLFRRHMIFLKSLSTLIMLDEVELAENGTATFSLHPEVEAETISDSLLVSRDSLAALWIRTLSPAAHIDNIKADTLLNTGGKPFFLPVVKISYNGKSIWNPVSLQWGTNARSVKPAMITVDNGGLSGTWKFNISGAGILTVDTKKENIEWSAQTPRAK